MRPSRTSLTREHPTPARGNRDVPSPRGARDANPRILGRRAFALGLAAAFSAPLGAWAAADRLADAAGRIAALEKSAGGRLGVAVLDPASGARLLHRASERFPMCSTFKLMAAAAVLKRVDAGEDSLSRFVPYGEADMIDYAPATKANLAAGGMTLGALCAAAVELSDNVAANLILTAIGGPAGFTAFARALGDSITRLDRNEPTLNTAIPGDPRDTTSPLAMAQDLGALLLGPALSPASRTQLEAWMIADKVGGKRLRAGLPSDWGIGDKTGTGAHGTANTIGILRPPGRGPLFAAVYYTEGPVALDAREAVNREVGGIIATAF